MEQELLKPTLALDGGFALQPNYADRQTLTHQQVPAIFILQFRVVTGD